MDKQVSLIKSILPSIVKNLSQFFELDLTIKLFGVKVFQFHFPPASDVEPQNNDLPC